jgi:thiol-disulfide isomerase/thioredoxin
MRAGSADVIRKRLEEKLAEYYGQKSPPQSSVERLVRDACDAGATAPGHGSPSRAASARFGVVGLVAAFALLAALPAYYMGVRAGRDGAASASALPPAKPATGSAPAAPPTLKPRLVLARIHADWCPRSPTIAPLFQELLDRYGNDAVMVVTLDITSPQTRRQAMLLADSLGIVGQIGIAYDGDMVKLEPGMIRLIDRDKHDVMATLRSVDERPDFERTLALALPSQSDSDMR